MGDKELTFGQNIVLVVILLLLVAGIFVPMSLFSTRGYDCILPNTSNNEVMEIYQLSGSAMKVWVEEAQELQDGMWHLTLNARQAGGENDIDTLLDLVGVKYYRLDD